uniref:Uncharacterized protein n=1 Tax=Eutreptiella gymnastica TaxID=73025 RepID=A0A7S4GDB7_9EUGL|mmetsp:Transcript_7797/g.11787  ORF Transcript_7797/g.11787 Transcript_7797/m.11787 type:complete len:132 (-) Transcript_7797:234-629(-)
MGQIWQEIGSEIPDEKKEEPNGDIDVAACGSVCNVSTPATPVPVNWRTNSLLLRVRLISMWLQRGMVGGDDTACTLRRSHFRQPGRSGKNPGGKCEMVGSSGGQEPSCSRDTRLRRCAVRTRRKCLRPPQP